MGEYNGSAEDDQDFGDMFSHSKKPAHKPSLWISLLGTFARLIVIALLVLGCLGIYKLIQDKKSQPKPISNASTIQERLKNLSATFPLYYPTNPPVSFIPDASSVTSQSNIVSFHYSHNDQPVVVTEQARPPIIEQVKKTKTIDSLIGTAYLADLEGHTTGFIQTAKSLIIVSSVENLDDESLLQFIQSFNKVD